MCNLDSLGHQLLAIDHSLDAAMDKTPMIIENCNTGVIHKVTRGRTLCGMYLGKWPHKQHPSFPQEVGREFYCSRCCRVERHALLAIGDGDSTNSD